MNVRVQFYAQLRDIAGKSDSTVDIPANGTVSDLLHELYQKNPSLRSHDKTILVGAGLEFVGRDYIIKPNETISIMPPVQGG
jgi:molybdopterin converting factor small subunit